jgi:hypothetical protein
MAGLADRAALICRLRRERGVSVMNPAAAAWILSRRGATTHRVLSRNRLVNAQRPVLDPRSERDGFGWIGWRGSRGLGGRPGWLASDGNAVLIDGVVWRHRSAGGGIGQGLDDQWWSCAVVGAESGYPEQVAGFGLDDSPAAFVSESVIMPARRPDVGVVGGATACPVLDVVAVGSVCRSAAAWVRAGAVADLRR